MNHSAVYIGQPLIATAVAEGQSLVVDTHLVQDRGVAFGESDEFGNGVAKDSIDIHDIHATILHQMGVDHERLTFRHGGRDQRLTDVHGRVIHEILASP